MRASGGLTYLPLSKDFTKTVRYLYSATNNITTLAGKDCVYTCINRDCSCNTFQDGPQATAIFGTLNGVATDSANAIYISDGQPFVGYGRIRKLASGQVTTVAGGNYAAGQYADGPMSSAYFGIIQGIAFDPFGNLLVADLNLNCIRNISFATGNVSTVTCAIYQPRFIVCDPRNGMMYVATSNSQLYSLTPSGSVSFMASSANGVTFIVINALAIDPTGSVYVSDLFGNVWKFQAPVT